jgi:P4 family phage/plasmid primase-like protien
MGNKFLKRRRDLLSAKTVAAVERLARSDPRAAAKEDQWDSDDVVLNTPAGLVDLRTGAVAPNRPTTYATKITAAGPGGDCPRWRKFLDEVTGGDPELASFLQRVAGYAATGLTSEHAFFFLYGSGANGKGTFLNTLVRLLGDYATVAPMETFTDSNSDRHPTELAMLRMVRLVVSQETEEGRRWAESRIKLMTGGDPIKARFMKRDFFTFQPKFKLLIAGNHKPKLVNVDEAMRRRLHLIPFTVTIPKADRDKNLAATLATEADGIMAWIVQGAVDYLRVGLAPPGAVSDATASYFGAEDTFAQWLEDRCETGIGHWDTSGRLFVAWKLFAESANIRAGDQKSFANRLESAGFNAGNSRAMGGRHWLGLRLKIEESDGREEWQNR